MEKMLKVNNIKFNGLWMIADFKLYNKKTRSLEKLIKFSLDNRKPLLAFSEPFIKAGSFFSVSTDNRSLGSQIALISKQVVHDKTLPSSIPVAPPIGTFTVINKNVAREILGDKFDESIIYQVDKVYPAEEGD
jgi:putative ABC transport system substrate-binding protein